MTIHSLELVIMKKKKSGTIKVRKRISDCKRRLDNLKRQGFDFSQDIYNDLDRVKHKILKTTMIYRMWNKRLQISAGLVIIFVSFTVSYILLSQNYIEMNIDNVEPEMEIDKRLYDKIIISGTAVYENRFLPFFQIKPITSVKIKIDNAIFETIQVIDGYWNYTLNIHNLSIGFHNLTFRCTDGNHKIDSIRKINITGDIEIPKPIVKILNPFEDDKNLSGIITIIGSAYAKDSQIESVKIKFNEENQWLNTTLGNNENSAITWRKNWNTKDVDNGNCTIYAKSFNDSSESNEYTTNVTILNIDRPFVFPSEGPFNFYIPLKYESDLLIPGEIYEVKGYHKASEEMGLLKPKITTFIKIQAKPDWLNIYIPEDEIITPKDNVTYTFSIKMSINENADMNSDSAFTVAWTYTTPPFTGLYKLFPSFAKLYDKLIGSTYDVTIYTGEW